MAEQLEFFEIQSPCRGICQTNEQGYCRGCYRSREERFGWLKFTDPQKRNILRLCCQRYMRSLAIKKTQEDPPTAQQELF
ncbi:DUF1289 domain-containing protein [Providencia manganoxydans]|uniref:DUF1289 domain-containing protein n=1 Tax=Providencia manganoxydans TaxID=2923283 RepID=UPI0034E5A054